MPSLDATQLELHKLVHKFVDFKQPEIKYGYRISLE